MEFEKSRYKLMNAWLPISGETYSSLDKALIAARGAPFEHVQEFLRQVKLKRDLVDRDIKDAFQEQTAR